MKSRVPISLIPMGRYLTAGMRLLAVIAMGWPIVGCDRGARTESGQNADDSAALTVSPIDSVVPMQVAIEQFQAGLPNPGTLQYGEVTRDRLVEHFITSLASGDTTALVRMTLNRAEFAWLYYPTTREAFPPYELPPDLAWFRLTLANEKGLGRVLRELGGHADLRLVRYLCASEPVIEAANTIWGGCVVTVSSQGSTHGPLGLFGAIIERGGHFKFISYANDF